MDVWEKVTKRIDENRFNRKIDEIAKNIAHRICEDEIVYDDEPEPFENDDDPEPFEGDDDNETEYYAYGLSFTDEGEDKYAIYITDNGDEDMADNEIEEKEGITVTDSRMLPPSPFIPEDIPNVLTDAYNHSKNGLIFITEEAGTYFMNLDTQVDVFNDFDANCIF